MLDTSHELSNERLLRLVDEAAALGAVDWLISGGGEPTVRPVTFELMKRIKQRGMQGDIITNGTLLREEQLSSLVSLGWDSIRVSILGPDAETHDRLANAPGSFEKAMRALRTIARLKEDLGRDAPEIGFNTVLSSGNYMHLPEMVAVLAEFGGNNINTQTIILYSKEEEWTSLNEEQRKEFPRYAREAVYLAKKQGIRTNLGSYLDRDVAQRGAKFERIHELMDTPFEGFLGNHCFEQFYLMTVRANGIVGSCRLFGDEGTSLHGQSLGEVWYGPYFTRAREQVLRHELFNYCRHCNANEYMENLKIRERLVPAAREAGLAVIPKAGGRGR